MIILFYLVSIFLSCCNSAPDRNISNPICPESFICPGLAPFKYPFYNSTDTRCGLIKVNCTSKGGEVQIGGPSYEIAGKFYSDDNSTTLLIRNTTFEQLMNNQSCRALTDDLSSPSPTPFLYSSSIASFITLFKCPKNPTFYQQTDAYFKKQSYNTYNKCIDYKFYYNYLKGTVSNRNDIPHACQVVQLPVRVPGPGLNESNIFSLLSPYISIKFKMSPSCYDCYIKGRLCDTENGQDVQCSNIMNEIPGREPSPNGGRKFLRLILVLVVVLGVGCVTILIIIILRKKRITGRRKNTKYNVKVELFLKNHEFLAPKRYNYSQVEKMTNSFRVKLGQGGFGAVYKGVLKNQNPVAVKVLSEVKGDGEDFINEVASVGMTSHVNIVSLLGFCLEGCQRALIYEFMPNGSLERFIYSRGSSTSSQLGWEKLHQIAIGIARGLEYLYRGCSTRILHFDIKPHNILLDKDFCPKISDFGLAKLFREKESKISISHMRGTPGYIAPELFSRNFGDISHKSDVYSYGMMILEMVGGRKNIEVEVDHTSEIYFPHWIYKKIELHEEQLGLNDIVCDEENMIARKLIIVGLWCIQTNPLSRPTITRVLEMLEGDLALLEIPPKPYITSPSRCVGSPSIESLIPYSSSI